MKYKIYLHKNKADVQSYHLIYRIWKRTEYPISRIYIVLNHKRD